MREFQAVSGRGRDGRWRRRALISLGFAVSGVFTYFAVRDVDFDEVWRSLRESNYWWAIPALAVLAVSVALRSLRWQYLFPAETRPPYVPVLNATILGQFFNQILPVRAGEVARVIALNQSARTSRVEATATVVVERAYDVLALLVILFVAVPWLPRVTWIRAAAILAIVLVAVLVAAVLVLARFGERPVRFLLRPFARLPFVSVERTELAASNLVRGAASIQRPGLAAVALVLTGVSWLLLGLSCWILTLGFDLGLPFGAGLLVIVALGLGMILPSSPAAVGVFEAATLVALNAYGVPDSQALSYALVLHAVNFFPYIGAGLVVFHLHAVTYRKRPA